MRLTVRLCAFVVTLLACFSATNQVLAQTSPVTAGQVIISELRYRGPNGIRDEFVELYNNTNNPIVVQASDASAGWALVMSNGSITVNFCLIPNGTIIPARGHFLCANTDPDFGSGYSLAAYPAGRSSSPCSPTPTRFASLLPPSFGPTSPDQVFTIANDLPDGYGVALFKTQLTPNQNAANRLDAFGFTASPALFKEGTGFPTIPNTSNEHTLYRNLSAALPKDTNNNAADFLFVATTSSIQTTQNGAPGPENRCSPIVNNATINISLIAPSTPASQPPNQARVLTPEANAALGTLFIRRQFTNNTGQPVTRLRFRLVNFTTRGTPQNTCLANNCADLRALTSADDAPSGIPVRGVRLEDDPPLTPEGGGMNSSLSADFITIFQPLLPGSSVNINFKLGVMDPGHFRFFINIEALSEPVISP